MIAEINRDNLRIRTGSSKRLFSKVVITIILKIRGRLMKSNKKMSNSTGFIGTSQKQPVSDLRTSISSIKQVKKQIIKPNRLNKS